MVNRPSSNVVTPGQGLNRVPINNFLNPVPNNFPSRISEPINIQPPTPRLQKTKLNNININERSSFQIENKREDHSPY